MTIFDDIRKDREAAQTYGFHWIGETLMAKEYDEVVELCSVDWSDLDECEAEHKRRIARVPRLERIALAAEGNIRVAECFLELMKITMNDHAMRLDANRIMDFCQGVRETSEALAAFRAACGEGE